MFCANWLISSRVIVTVSVVDGTVPPILRLVASRCVVKDSIDSILVGLDSTNDPATLDWSEVDWKEEMEELVSSTMKGLALWLLPLLDSTLLLLVAALVFNTPWIFFKCLVRSPNKWRQRLKKSHLILEEVLKNQTKYTKYLKSGV